MVGIVLDRLADIEQYASALGLSGLVVERVQLGGVQRLSCERRFPDGRIRSLLIHWAGDCAGLPDDSYAIAGHEYGGDLDMAVDGKHWGSRENMKAVVRHWLGGVTMVWNDLPRD